MTSLPRVRSSSRTTAFVLCSLACFARPWIAEAQEPSGVQGGEALIAQQVDRLTSGEAEQEQQARRWLARLDIEALPVLIGLRGHASPRVRHWAERGIGLLGMQDPAIATALSDSHLVSRVIRAYADPLDREALPVVAGFLGDGRMEVREAARWTVDRFGKEGLVPLAEAYLEASGKRAHPSWDARRIVRELYAVLDQPAMEQAEGLLAQGLSAFISGDLETMKRRFDQALIVYPFFERRSEMAPGYAAYGEKLLQADDLEAAASALGRALRLGPGQAAAEKWQSQLAFIRSEQRLQAGVVDLEGYRKALELDRKNAPAASALDRMGGAWLERHRARKQWARVGSVALLGVFAALLLFRKSRGVRSHGDGAR